MPMISSFLPFLFSQGPIHNTTCHGFSPGVITTQLIPPTAASRRALEGRLISKINSCCLNQRKPGELPPQPVLRIYPPDQLQFLFSHRPTQAQHPAPKCRVAGHACFRGGRERRAAAADGNQPSAEFEDVAW